MIEYNYCDKDLLRYPEKYQMSAYGGIWFLHAYSNSRHNVLEKLNVCSSESFGKFIIENFAVNEISIDFIHTTKFLSLTLIEKINKNINKQNEVILDVFLKKFEVKKKIFTKYDKQYKEKTEDYFDLENYILLSANFIVTYQQTMNLKYLNACLKLNDLVISNLDKVHDKRFRKLFFMILHAELDCINNLCLKKGIR